MLFCFCVPKRSKTKSSLRNLVMENEKNINKNKKIIVGNQKGESKMRLSSRHRQTHKYKNAAEKSLFNRIGIILIQFTHYLSTK